MKVSEDRKRSTYLFKVNSMGFSYKTKKYMLHINNNVIFNNWYKYQISLQFCCWVFLFQNLKNVIQILIEDYMIYLKKL